MEGVGVFGLALGKSFEDGGFLALVLYPLLEKLASTNSNVNYAADLALRAICYYSGYQSVSDASPGTQFFYVVPSFWNSENGRLQSV